MNRYYLWHWMNNKWYLSDAGNGSDRNGFRDINLAHRDADHYSKVRPYVVRESKTIPPDGKPYEV